MSLWVAEEGSTLSHAIEGLSPNLALRSLWPVLLRLGTWLSLSVMPLCQYTDVFLISFLSCLPTDVCWGEAPFWGLCPKWLWLQQAESAETDLPGSSGLQVGLLPARQLQIQVKLDKASHREG